LRIVEDGTPDVHSPDRGEDPSVIVREWCREHVSRLL
jgi:hypothetical protein